MTAFFLVFNVLIIPCSYHIALPDGHFKKGNISTKHHMVSVASNFLVINVFYIDLQLIKAGRNVK